MHQSTRARLLCFGMLCWLGPAALPAVVAAQSDSTRTPAAEPHPLCWRGKPAPKCGMFWITEFGYDFVNSSTSRRYVVNPGADFEYAETIRDFESRLIWTVGPMLNRGHLRAIGGTLSLSPVAEGSRAAIELRRRWWTPEGSSFDLSAGALRVDVFRPYPLRREAAFGVTGGAYLVGGDLIQINGRADVVLTGGKPRVGTSLGIGLGSYAAAVGTAALGAFVALIFAAYAGEGT